MTSLTLDGECYAARRATLQALSVTGRVCRGSPDTYYLPESGDRGTGGKREIILLLKKIRVHFIIYFVKTM